MSNQGGSSPAAGLAGQRVEAVWRERAIRLSRRSNLAGARENTSPVVVLGIGKERYGIALEDVAEVFPPVQPTPVPGAPASFSGVINVHGEIRPVIDLRHVLGMETARTPDLARVILLRKDGREMSLQIDSVEQIRWISGDELMVDDTVEERVISSETGAAGRAGDWASPQHISTHIRGSTRDRLMLLSTDALFAELDSAKL